MPWKHFLVIPVLPQEIDLAALCCHEVEGEDLAREGCGSYQQTKDKAKNLHRWCRDGWRVATSLCSRASALSSWSCFTPFRDTADWPRRWLNESMRLFFCV